MTHYNGALCDWMAALSLPQMSRCVGAQVREAAAVDAAAVDGCCCSGWLLLQWLLLPRVLARRETEALAARSCL
jgi:hypothetical protein